MMSRDEALAAAERQCEAHGIDFHTPAIRGAITNLLTPILLEWSLDLEELKSLREQIRKSADRARFLEHTNEDDGA